MFDVGKYPGIKELLHSWKKYKKHMLATRGQKWGWSGTVSDNFPNIFITTKWGVSPLHPRPQDLHPRLVKIQILQYKEK